MTKFPKNIFSKLKNQKKEELDSVDYLWNYKPFWVVLIITVLSLPIFLISYLSPVFCEWYSRTVGNFIRMLTAKISGILPFSLAEFFVVFIVFFVIFALVKGIYEIVKRIPYKERFDITFNRFIACFFLISFSLYNFSFATSNGRFPLEKNMELEIKAIDRTQLVKFTEDIVQEINDCVSQMDFRSTPDGASCLPYSYTQLNKILNDLYFEYSKENKFIAGFSSNVKRVALSSLMTYTHISGIYVPFTGEANININYPDYVTAFTYAHEMAHQRGIARENEANFVAFCVMYESCDFYLKYSALMQLFDYLCDAIYLENQEEFYRILSICDERVLREKISYSGFFMPYVNSVASNVMGAVNDTSIKLRGDSDGVKSYNKMIELSVAYFEKRNSFIVK